VALTAYATAALPAGAFADAALADTAALEVETDVVAESGPLNPTSDFESVAQAFSVLGPNVWRILQRMGVVTSALEDALQDVFLVAHRNWHTFRGESQRRTWILGIALRVASKYRKQTRHPLNGVQLQPGELDQQSNLESASPFDLASLREAHFELQELLTELDDDDRALVVLVHCEDLMIGEAARVLGLRTRRAYGLLERAEAKLRKAMVRRKAQDEWKLR
jgi:RNA polymerase sigma-70 factor, ECF subfamily